MFYYLVALIFILLVALYITSKKGLHESKNLMEDVPIINVNKEGLEKHAAEITNFYSDTRVTNCRRKLIKSLDRSFKMIVKAFEYIDIDARDKKEIVPVAEWLLDNLSLIEKEYKDIKYNMPAAYYKDLPVINSGIMKGFPRVYHIAVELVSHTDGRVDENTIEIFIKSYQKAIILSSGELWALPIMLRIAMIQNISKISEKIVYAQEEKKRGEIFAERLINALNENKLDSEIEKISKEDTIFSCHFTERLIKVLRDNGIDNQQIHEWIDNKLESVESSSEKMVSIEHQRQANFQLSMGNSITGIREVEAINWREFFEEISYVEQILRADPSRIYSEMEFGSRDYYRHTIEDLSKYMKTAESFIAKKALECALEAEVEVEVESDNGYVKHIGFYLIDDGLAALKEKLGFKDRGIRKISEAIKKDGTNFYITVISVCTLFLTSIVLYFNYMYSYKLAFWECIIAFFVILIPCSEIIISILNWSINSLMKPAYIPKMQFKDGFTEECSTIVVIPTLVNSIEKVHNIMSDIEVYYLANQEKNLYFALLSDFVDSKFEHEKNDDVIIAEAMSAVAELNKMYCSDGNDIFFFLSRYRQYNAKENKWLGWERKRGKLMEFNSLIRGAKNTSYNVISGNIENLQKIKYVITLDADTQLPRDTAKRLVGAISHILNRAHVDKKHKKVSRGYGLMQPRVSVGTISANKTFYSKTFSGETGIDMYTSAISDVYQDLMGEGSFTGKGIYDVDVFNYILKDEIPENAVLSHDLLEGSYVRTALLTDVELIDGYPAYYNASSKRLHRWVRGDWQLIPWLASKSINTLAKWKIIDNLRRSLLSTSIIVLVIITLGFLPGEERWLIIAFLAILCPLFFDVTEAVVSPIKGISLSGKANSRKKVIEQVFLIFSFLPYQGYNMVDAIIRTLYRLIISKKNLLEWQTAADVESKSGKNLKSYISEMWIASVISILILTISFINSMKMGLFMLPSALIWFLSPYIAYSISKDIKVEDVKLNESQKKILRRIARRTWAYFQDFVSVDNNWLPPDNYQQDPPNGIAHRTSPTNLGMGLTSNITAYDLGYLGILEFVDRLDNILSSMEGLNRYKGHFYNWYNTKTKEPLYPRYISTVDSGNLVGYLWETSETINEYKGHPIINSSMNEGLRDTLILCDIEINRNSDLVNFYGKTISEIESTEFDLVTWKMILLDIWSKTIELEKLKNCDRLYWVKKIKQTISKQLKELQCFFPWSDIIIEKPDKMDEIAEKLKNTASKTPINMVVKELDSILTSLNMIKTNNADERDWAERLTHFIEYSKKETEKVLLKLENINVRLNNLAEATDFNLLYNKNRQLFSIGYDIEKENINNCYYDLLASEARQASFVAIAKGDVEQDHWFKLGRSMAYTDKSSKVLVSWSGTMFEYFMPLLIMKNYPDTLFNETYKSVVEGQKRFCHDRRVPWGISESAFYGFDINLNYQYKAFGVPGIGLKRGLMNELVISPYSTVLAMQIDKLGGFNNIQKLISDGMEGLYGFYEAADYTKDRIEKSKKKSIVKCFMIHHQGMSLMALDNILNNKILQERFHRIPKVKATELLLQERVPNRVIYDRQQQFEVTDVSIEKQNIVARTYDTALTERPETHMISNGSYSLMISNSGSGYSKKDDMTVYRWREDATQDNSGMFFYIKNVNSDEFWSASYEPCKSEGDEYEAIFSLDKAEFKRRDGNISTHTDITVSYEDNAEVRKVSLTNHSDHSRIIEVTSYLEVTLCSYNADIAHPAFSNLFIKTYYVDNPTCIIAKRRPREKDEKIKFVMQTVVVEGETIGTAQYETNRENFIGRGRDLSCPIVMENDAPLKNNVGAVIDPIISIRRRVKIHPGETCVVAYTTAIVDSKEEAIELARKYSEMQNISRTFEIAWTHTQVEMKYLGLKSSQINLYQLLASKIIFMNHMIKNREEYIKNIQRGQSALWAYGVSGDLPIVLVIVKEDNDVDIVRQMLNAHEYWSIKGLKVDLIILNLQSDSYFQPLQDAVRDIILSSFSRDRQNKPGGVFLLNKSTIDEEDIKLLMAVSRMVIDSDNNILDKIRNKSIEDKIEILETKEQNYNSKPENIIGKELLFYNGFGGFNEIGNEYVIKLNNQVNTPAPWINVISNENFGFHVSENGASYTWCKNSHEFKLTPWFNDPVTDKAGEAIYLRDEVNGEIWGVTPKPIRDESEYIIEHGFGYSRFKHESNGFYTETTMFVPLKENVKLICVKIKNNSDIERNISVTYFAEMVLGVVSQSSAQYISTFINNESKYIYAKNAYNDNFRNMRCYLKMFGGTNETFTGNRMAFIGRGGRLDKPVALSGRCLYNTVGAGVDPCICENVKLSVKVGEVKEIVIMFGAEESTETIEGLQEKYENLENVLREFNNVKDFWKKTLYKIQVKTPDKSMDLLLNGWLLYQTITCRFWSRTAFYQSGGAFGFRDQLQDVMAIGYVDSKITRSHIIYCAGRQFVEGDVQHWWHPVVDSGIRTKFSDDLLWLPYVVADYIENTGDYSILQENAGYLQDTELKEFENERYNISAKSAIQGTIYEHCIKAIERSLHFGQHNIPLMGSGDWNDGMNTVGNLGSGESVWLGWFLFKILNQFIDICNYAKDIKNVNKFNELKEFLKVNLEENAWDGSWYRRAYFDDGTPLGSMENDECQIDSISQSWAVISGAAKKSRAIVAMDALDKYLIKEKEGMILLLTPPFNRSKLEPGYIKGYVPGVRENGGQYTHAAVWTVLALTKLGQNNKAWKMFNMINPINHSKSYLESERYKVEPYVMTADVYEKEPHTGRGGWSWYTGAAGWMYRTGIENILGLKYLGSNGFTISPCVPDDWKEYSIQYNKEECIYNIKVIHGEKKGIYMDEKLLPDGMIPYMQEGLYKIEVII